MMSNKSNSFTTLKFEFYGIEVSCAAGYAAYRKMGRNTENGCKKKSTSGRSWSMLISLGSVCAGPEGFKFLLSKRVRQLKVPTHMQQTGRFSFKLSQKC